MGGFSVLGSEDGGEGGATAREPRLDRPFGTTLDPSDLRDREFAEIVEHKGPPLRLGQLLECGDECRGCLRWRGNGLRSP
jgi:hypothetical protein